MKLLLSVLALVCLLAVSCNKPDDAPPAAKNNTWKLGATTYTVNNYASNTTDDFQAYDLAGNGLNISFAALPTADGSYNVVGNSSSLGPNDIHVVAFGPVSGNSYFATGYDHTIATVKVLSATRFAVSLPDTWVVKGGTDSMKLSVNIGDL
jgi:hypothetical protein